MGKEMPVRNKPIEVPNEGEKVIGHYQRWKIDVGTLVCHQET